MRKVIRKSLVLLIQLYRILISPFLGYRCRFYPTCSLYAQIAIEKHGVFYGGWLAFKRILKCHPWYHGESYDPVPEKEQKIKEVLC